jgi:hypothetical protein
MCPAELPDGGDAGGEAPRDEICVFDRCHPLRRTLRDALVLWLDPDNLPPAGQPVEMWHDKSGRGHNAVPVVARALPISKGRDGVRFNRQVGGAAMKVLHVDDLDFSKGDFALLLVATVDNTADSCFLQKGDMAPVPLTSRVGLEWKFGGTGSTPRLLFQFNVNHPLVIAPLVHERVYLIRATRQKDQLFLQLNGALDKKMAMPIPPQDSPVDYRPLLLGTCTDASSPVTDLKAVVILNGPLVSTDVEDLEQFLIERFGIVP